MEFISSDTNVWLDFELIFLSEEYMRRFSRPSIYDCVALAIAKCRGLVLMTGDGALRKAARQEGVAVVGTIGVLDKLFESDSISQDDYLECLERLRQMNGGKVRLPAKEIEERINNIKRNT